MIENVSVQDRDLLGRLNGYFSTIDQRIREGEGWLIFNSGRQRAVRLLRFITDRLQESRPFVSYYVIPWRDFALNAYMSEVELPVERTQTPPEVLEAKPEYKIAAQVDRDIRYHMLYSDLLVLSGVAPKHPHEADYLDQVIEERYGRHRASIVITPRMPHELVADLEALRPGGKLWERFFDRMYSTSLIAI